MANEVIGIGRSVNNGRVETQMVYVYPIVPRVVDAVGAQVIPAYDLATMPLSLKSQLTAAQVSAINAGDAGFVVTNLTKSAGETDPQFVARVRVDYDALTAFYLQQRRDQAVEANDFDQRRFNFNR